MSRGWMVGVIGMALLVRGLVHLTAAPATPTTWESEELAVNLAEGRGFRYAHLGTVYRAYKPPLYELLCAGIYRVMGHRHLPVRLMQWGFGALLAGTVWLIARRGWGARVAVAAGMAAAVHPALVFYDTHQLAALTLAAWLIAVVVWVGLWADERPAARRLAFLGAAIGLAMYERGTAGVLLPVSVAWLGWRHRPLGWWRVTGPIAAGWLVIVAPWLIRNLSVYHQAVGMTSVTGELLWRGNHPGATGTTVTEDLVPVLQAAPPEFARRLEGLGELDQQAVFRREALAFIRTHPGEALRLFLRKLGYFWWFAPTSGWRYPPVYLTVYRVLYAGILVTALIGLWSAYAQGSAAARAAAGWIVLTAAALSLAQAVYYVEIRHRWAVEPLLLILSAAGLQRLKRLCCHTPRAPGLPTAVGAGRALRSGDRWPAPPRRAALDRFWRSSSLRSDTMAAPKSARPPHEGAPPPRPPSGGWRRDARDVLSRISPVRAARSGATPWRAAARRAGFLAGESGPVRRSSIPSKPVASASRRCFLKPCISSASSPA